MHHKHITLNRTLDNLHFHIQEPTPAQPPPQSPQPKLPNKIPLLCPTCCLLALCLASKIFSFIFLNFDPGMVPQNMIGICRLLLLPDLAAADSKPNMNLKYKHVQQQIVQDPGDVRCVVSAQDPSILLHVLAPLLVIISWPLDVQRSRLHKLQRSCLDVLPRNMRPSLATPID